MIEAEGRSFGPTKSILLFNSSRYIISPSLNSKLIPQRPLNSLSIEHAPPPVTVPLVERVLRDHVVTGSPAATAALGVYEDAAAAGAGGVGALCVCGQDLLGRSQFTSKPASEPFEQPQGQLQEPFEHPARATTWTYKHCTIFLAMS